MKLQIANKTTNEVTRIKFENTKFMVLKIETINQIFETITLVLDVINLILWFLEHKSQLYRYILP